MNTTTLFSSNKHDWTTPKDFFNKLDEEFNFTLDPCCYPETALCKKYYTEKEDGLRQSWQGETVFLQSPIWKRNQEMGNKSIRGE